MFTKAERSGFKYFFAHWCAFQMTALNQKCWKPKYLLHDLEKPFLKLIWPYKKLQKWHRFHNNHHIEYYFYNYAKHGKCDDYDFEATCIDWECSRFTKANCPRNAKEEIEAQYKEVYACKNEYINSIISDNLEAFSGDSRYTILVEKFFGKMREKLEEIGLN